MGEGWCWYRDWRSILTPGCDMGEVVMRGDEGPGPGVRWTPPRSPHQATGHVQHTQTGLGKHPIQSGWAVHHWQANTIYTAHNQWSMCPSPIHRLPCSITKILANRYNPADSHYPAGWIQKAGPVNFAVWWDFPLTEILTERRLTVHTMWQL